MDNAVTTSNDLALRGKRPALGRGLGALIPTKPSTTTTTTVADAPPGGSFYKLAIEQVQPNRDQPRQHFDDEGIAELAASIREHGVLQPILVRRDGARSYVIVAGERRWRAAQKAGLREIPAVISEHDANDALLLALVENLQREDLNPIEEAEAYRRLIDEYRLTQEQVAERVGKDRSSVANAMRLLKLPESVRELVKVGELNMGHARALLALDDVSTIERLAREVVRKNLSVRDVEKRVKLARLGAKPQVTKPAESEAAPLPVTPAVRDLQEKLIRALATRVTVKDKGNGQGTIEIAYATLDDLDRILAHILR